MRSIGEPRLHDVFYVANHVSWIDILAMGGATGCAFVSKDDVGRWPIVGWLAAQNNTILVARDRRAAIDQQIGAMRAAMASHQPVALFPEGTTGNGHTLLPFKPTLLAVLLPPPRDIVIQPVAISYGDDHADIAWHGEEGAAANLARVVGRKGRLEVTLHFLPPIVPGDYADRKALAAACRDAIAAALPPPPSQTRIAPV